MPEHTAIITWVRGSQKFTDNKYSRAHKWKFDGGIEVAASSSPFVIPVPYSTAAAIDPEEAFVASISSCHMLWFLSIAVKEKWCVDSYTDESFGIMRKNEAGYLYIASIVLRPKVLFSGVKIPTGQEQILMHDKAHKLCFIANSIKSDVQCKPIL